MRMRRNPPIENKRLFTLVELVAAMAIMIFVALIIGTASAAFYNAWKRSVRVTDMLKVRQNIDRIMDVSIRNMIPFSWKDEDDREQVVFAGSQNEIFFTTRRRAAEGENSAFLFIRLKVNDDGQLIAEYHTLPRFPWQEEGKYEMKTEVLAENIQSISFLYASQEEEEIVWNEDWEEYDPDTLQDDTTDIQMIPLAVQMTVEWKDGSKEVWLRRTTGASQYSRFGGGGGLARSESAQTSGQGSGQGNRNRQWQGGQGGMQGGQGGNGNRGGQGGMQGGQGGNGTRGGQGSGQSGSRNNRGNQGGNRGGSR